jgi:hypothetical protein
MVSMSGSFKSFLAFLKYRKKASIAKDRPNIPTRASVAPTMVAVLKLGSLSFNQRYSSTKCRIRTCYPSFH